MVGTSHSQQNFDLEFWDIDFEGEKDEKDKDVACNLQSMGTAEHYGITDAEWDPTGRYFTTVASFWKHTVCSQLNVNLYHALILSG